MRLQIVLLIVKIGKPVLEKLMELEVQLIYGGKKKIKET